MARRCASVCRMSGLNTDATCGTQSAIPCGSPAAVPAAMGQTSGRFQAPKSGSPAASQVTSTAPPTCGVNDLERFGGDAFPAPWPRNRRFDAA